MLRSPHRASAGSSAHAIAPPESSWPDIDDDDGWEDMPVVRSDDNPLGLDDEDQKKFHYKPPARLDDGAGSPTPGTTGDTGAGGGGTAGGATASSSNATGARLELEADTPWSESWRQKLDTVDESDYTRLRLDEDEESEEVHMRTKYLFDEDKAMTPLSQMQATKELLTEGQRVAYVGLCQLIARRMVRDMGRGWEGVKVKGATRGKGKERGDLPAVESGKVWMLKIMARLYQHMELEKAEQTMIESLAEHGVDPSDLVPALMTTHTVRNPEFDPAAKAAKDLGTVDEKEEEEEAGSDAGTETQTEPPPPPYSPPASLPQPSSTASSSSTSFMAPEPSRRINPFGDDDDEDENPFSSNLSGSTPNQSTRPPAAKTRPSPLEMPFGDEEEDGGDIGSSISPPPRSATSQSFGLASPKTPRKPSKTASSPLGDDADDGDITGAIEPPVEDALQTPSGKPRPEEEVQSTPRKELAVPEEPAALPSLPGVSTSLSNVDETVTLDIRWTVLCDLFLVLIADSVYDSRSRAFLEAVAASLGFGWLDVVRFENRVTDALEIQEGIESMKAGEVIEGRRKTGLKKRYAMMGVAAVGGGLVIGLSAGLLAPVIGAGLAGAFATVGITGTTGFLAGAGGAAMITTGGVLTGANIAGKGMARRTREVRTFELKPLHNNKRVSCYITMGGFMAGKFDDVRLPFSVMDPIAGDVLSVLWEPDMMNEMGDALKILTTEVLTQVGQQVLQATVMTALLSALQWPLILTKLGYLIDNPWSNALDRSRAAGLVLADTIMQRHAGVRPVSLIGFSLGARAIVYALIELAKNKAYGLVQDVFIFGTTITASRTTWLEARSAVGGRFVNAFATNDWMLGYLFRATSGGYNTVAGLRPVEGVPGLENVEVTEIITGHMSYRSLMPQLLEKVGIPVTADFFDEPEDPDVDMSVQERTIINEAEEDGKRNRRKLLGIFPRGSGRSAKSGSTTPKSGTQSRKTSGKGAVAADEDEADLPPREDGAHTPTQAAIVGSGPVGMSHSAGVSKDSLATTATEDEPDVKAIPKTAGFDFSAISRELGKDIDVSKIKEPSNPVRPAFAVSPAGGSSGPERSGSAPPLAPAAVPTDEAESGSQAVHTSDREDDEADDTPPSMTAATRSMADLTLEMPSWDRPASVPLPDASSSANLSPPLPSGSGSASWRFPAFGGGSASNAWSSSPSSSSTSSAIPRAAPPARPHPPEFMANPFASTGANETTTGGSLSGWGRKAPEEEDLATKNPW